MFAARAGAKHVYGVECSKIAESAAKIVEVNNLSESITIIKGLFNVHAGRDLEHIIWKYGAIFNIRNSADFRCRFRSQVYCSHITLGTISRLYLQLTPP